MREPALVALSQAIRPLGTVASFMNVGAHPDDELSALLAYCSRGLGVRTISVIATRGEGGQNQVGHEFGPALGVVRTRELEEASRLLGVTLRILSEEMDDPLCDFGFCRTPEEALARWGEEATLRRLVRVMREERPDVVMTSFRDEYGQHGHHRAMTRLTAEAVRRAGDPGVFPEQLAGGLGPWVVKKLYVPANPEQGLGGDGDVYLSTERGVPSVAVDVGEFDEVLGVSYEQLGEASRALHRSQGMGRRVEPGPRRLFAELVWRAARAPAGAPQGAGAPGALERSMWEGLPYTVGELAESLPDGCGGWAVSLRRIQESLDAVFAAFPERPRLLEAIHAALAQVRALRAELDGAGRGRLPEAVAGDLRFRLGVKERQLAAASGQAALLMAELRVQPGAGDCEVVRGQAVELQLSAFCGGRAPLSNVRLEVDAPPGWCVEPLPAAGRQPAETGTAGQSLRLSYNETVRQAFRLSVPADAPLLHPYRPLPLSGVVRYEVDGVEAAVGATLPRPLAVLPGVSLAVEPGTLLVNLREAGRALGVRVVATNHRPDPVEAAVRLEVPGGWQVNPERVSLRLEAGARERAALEVRPCPGLSEGAGRVRAVAECCGEVTSHAVRVIEHEHVGRAHVVEPAESRLVAFEWRAAPVRVGYVDSGFDSVAARLEELGFDVRRLGRDDLLWGDLARFDTIMLGVYAYGARPDLREANPRLLRYVRDGGHLIVQLHRPRDGWDPDRVPPYRLVIGRPSFNWRVTDEGAPVTLLEPVHPFFRWPNRIDEADWNGWVKDRGLYFPMEWAPQYAPLVATHDPGWEPLKGGMLFAHHGEGSYVYTSLAWYYQLETYVPGACRIVANMVSFPAYRKERG